MTLKYHIKIVQGSPKAAEVDSRSDGDLHIMGWIGILSQMKSMGLRKKLYLGRVQLLLKANSDAHSDLQVGDKQLLYRVLTN